MIRPRIRTSRTGNIGFTIVELLIVIVVIAVLASIVTVTYKGIQQRAFNVVRVNDARNMIGLITAYNAINGPRALASVDTSSNAFCIGENFTDLDPGPNRACFSGSGGAYYMYDSASLNAALKSIGSVSISSMPPAEQRNSNGSLSQQSSGPEIWFMGPAALVDGSRAFAYIAYILKGDNVDCGLRPILDYVSPNNYTAQSSSVNSGYNAGITFCEIYVPAE